VAAQIEAVVEPNGVFDYLRRKSVPLVAAWSGFHPGIVGSRRLIWQYRETVSMNMVQSRLIASVFVV
jgi:hypothetical protein